MLTRTAIESRPDPMKEVLWACRSAFATAAVFSFFINSMILVMPIYMFSLFDRVIGGGGNKATLTLLASFAIGTLAIQALIDMARTYLFVRVSTWIDRQVGEKILAVTLRRSTVRGSARDSELLEKMNSVREFLAGEQIYQLMDLPWVPLFLAFLFYMQFWIGTAATSIAVFLFLMALANKWYTDPVRAVGKTATQESLKKAAISLNNADVIDAMGMGTQMVHRWERDNDVAIERNSIYARRLGMMTAIAKSMQMASMMTVMTVCALLIMDPEVNLSRGAMMASVILVGRVLAPVQSLVSSWSNISSSLSDYKTIARVLRQAAATPLPDHFNERVPTGALSVEGLGFHPPTAPQPILTEINFTLQPGESLGIVGPSGSGKSTLARLLIGLDRPSQGHARLDGQEIHEWPAETLGPYLGYLPQDVELFGGTVRDNISRKADDWTIERVLDAARIANVDTMIKFMPQGYETVVGDRGVLLSGGQMQRVGLARALYGDVKFVVLDEPNSNLDTHGEQALAQAIQELKRRGVTVVVILHRPNILKVLDYVMVLVDGKVQKMGRQEEMLAILSRSDASKDNRTNSVITNKANV
jgi:PrtD family type I secretion system ABC transporter